MSEHDRAAAPEAVPEDPKPVDVGTVEALVRSQLAAAVGGRRGIIEAAVPGVIFTILWLTTDNLTLSVGCSLAVSGVALVLRLLQRSTIQYVFNAIVGIAIGWGFVKWAESLGATDDERKLAFYLPGILISLGYTVVLSASCLARWPALGFMLGAVTDDPVGWHKDPQIVKLCSRLTWLMLLPGAIGVLLQGPVWLLGSRGAISADLALVMLLVLRSGLGWALRIGSWSAMIWLLARNATPLQQDAAT